MIGCREATRFLRNLIRREDLREAASQALPLLAALAWMGDHDEEMALLAREALVSFCQTKASKYMVAKRRARLIEALKASGLAIPAVLGMAAFLIDSAQHSSRLIQEDKDKEQAENRKSLEAAWKSVTDAKQEVERLKRSRPKVDPSEMTVRAMAMEGQINEQIAALEFAAARKMTEAAQMEEELDQQKKKIEGMEMEALRQRVLILFKKYDADMSGGLDERELALLLADLEYTGVTRAGLGGNKVQEEYRGMVHDVFTQMDEDGSGSIGPEELAEWYKQRDGVGDLVSGQIEDAELARFCVSTLVFLVQQEEQEEAQKWGGLVSLADQASSPTMGPGLEGRKRRWQQMFSKTKSALVITDKAKEVHSAQLATTETDMDRAVRLMQQVLGRMRRNMLEITFLAWAEETRAAKGRVAIKYRCVRETTVRASFALSSPKLGVLSAGQEVEVFENEILRFGISRLKTEVGWVSDKQMNGSAIMKRIGGADAMGPVLKQALVEDKPDYGTLVVIVVQARGLPKMDLFGSVDPFAVCTCGSQPSQQTEVRKKNRNPEWKHQMQFKRVQTSDEFTIQLFDFDMANANDPMGEVSRTVKEIGTKVSAFRSANDRWFTLAPMGGCENPVGEVRLRCEWTSDSISDTPAYAVQGDPLPEFYLSTEAPSWKTLMQTVVPLLICNDMSVRTAMANLARSLVNSSLARKAFCEIEDSMYNLLTLYSTFHPPIKRDCAHALSALVREIPGTADRLCHKLRWTVVAPLLNVGSPDTIIGACDLLRQVAANASPTIKKKAISMMMRALNDVDYLEVLPKNIRRAQTTRMGLVEFADAPELALPTFLMISEIIVVHQKSRMQWCRNEEAVRALLWHVERGSTRVRRAAAAVCAQFASHMECQENIFSNGADRLMFRFPHKGGPNDQVGLNLNSKTIENDKQCAVSVGCCICLLAGHSQNQNEWLRQGGLRILHHLLELKDGEVDACAAGALSALASNGKLTVLSKGVRLLSKKANVALEPLGRLCHSEHPPAKQLAVNAVWQLSKQLDDLSVLPKEGGLDTVFPMLYTSSQRIHAWASTYLLDVALGREAERELLALQGALHKAGTPEAIDFQAAHLQRLDKYVEHTNFMCMIKCARTSAVATTRRSLEDTIAHLCEDPVRREAAFSIGSYYTLQIVANYPQHLEWAVRQLHAVSVDDDPDAEVARHVCGMQEGFRVIGSACFARYDISEELCCLVAEAMATFAVVPGLHKSLVQHGAATTIGAWAESEIEAVRVSACAALLSLSRGDLKLRVLLEDQVSLSELQWLMLESPDHRVVATVVEALRNMTVSSKLQIKAISTLGARENRTGPLVDRYTVLQDMFASIRRTVAEHTEVKEPAYALLRNICRCGSAHDACVDHLQWQALLACRLSSDESQQRWAVGCMVDIFGRARGTQLYGYLRNQDCLQMVTHGFQAKDEESILDTMHAVAALVSHCVVVLDSPYEDAMKIAEVKAARSFLANCGLLPYMELLLPEHRKYEDRITLAVMNVVGFVNGSTSKTGVYADVAAGKRAAQAIFDVLQEYRSLEFFSAVLERRHVTVIMTALRGLADLCRNDDVRALVVELYPLEMLMDMCVQENVKVRPAACKLLLELSRGPGIQKPLLTSHFMLRLVLLVRATKGKSRQIVDQVICVLAQLPQHEEDLQDIIIRRQGVEKAEADLRVQLRKVDVAKQYEGTVRGVVQEKAHAATEALELLTPAVEAAIVNENSKVEAWHHECRLFCLPDLIFAVLRNLEVDLELRKWYLRRFVLLIEGDNAAWYTQRPTVNIASPLSNDVSLGSEKLDPETVRALLTYATSSEVQTQVEYLTIFRVLASSTANHSHIILGDAVTTLAGLCDSPEQQIKEVAKDILSFLLKNFAVMRYFESRPDSHDMVVLAARILGDDVQVQRWASELLRDGGSITTNPARLTLQLLTDADTGMAEELAALRALGVHTNDATVQLNIATRLLKLTEANSKVRGQVCQVGGIDTLYSVLVSTDPSVQLVALRAALPVANDSVYRGTLLQAHAAAARGTEQVNNFVETICKILAESPPAVQVVAIEVLAALAIGDSAIREQYRKDISEMPDGGAADMLLLADKSNAREIKLAQQTDDAKSELQSELTRRDSEAAQHADFIAEMISANPEALQVLLRTAKPNPESALADGKIHAKNFICAIASADVGRELLRKDYTMVSLVVYINRGRLEELKHWCRMELAAKAAAETVSVIEWSEDSRKDRVAAKLASFAMRADAFPHLIEPIGLNDDLALRRLCLAALNNQLKDGYASKHCLHLPLLVNMMKCAGFVDDSRTRRGLCMLVKTLLHDKICQKRFCRKGYFELISALCDELPVDYSDDTEELVPTHHIGEDITLQLLERADAKEACVYGICTSAFETTLRRGPLHLQRWCAISMVEHAKDFVKRVKAVQKAARVKKIEAYSRVRGANPKFAPAAVSEAAASLKKPDSEAEVARVAVIFANIVLPYVQNFEPADWKQCACVQVLRHLVCTKLDVILALGSELFQLAIQLLRRESDIVQVEVCKLLEELVQNGFSDFSGSDKQFTSLKLYAKAPVTHSFFGQDDESEFRIFDTDGLRNIPPLMQSWFGTRMLTLDDQPAPFDMDPHPYIPIVDVASDEEEEEEEEIVFVPGSAPLPPLLRGEAKQRPAFAYPLAKEPVPLILPAEKWQYQKQDWLLGKVPRPLMFCRPVNLWDAAAKIETDDSDDPVPEEEQDVELDPVLEESLMAGQWEELDAALDPVSAQHDNARGAEFDHIKPINLL